MFGIKKPLKLINATEAAALTNSAIDPCVNNELQDIQRRINKATAEAKTEYKCQGIPRHLSKRIVENLEHRGFRVKDHFQNDSIGDMHYINIYWN